MKKNRKHEEMLRATSGFLIFFLMTAFIVTCCTILFMEIMASETGLELTSESIEAAAKWTFLNVILLSLLFTAFDLYRRRVTVIKPAREIIRAADRMMHGDFSVRVPEMSRLTTGAELAEIGEQMNRMATELEGSETLKSDFIANVSHEIRTPLAVIRNSAELLTAGKLSEDERREYTETISRTAAKLAELVGNILKLNKLEHKQLSPAEADYDLSAQLAECLIGFEDAWEKKSLEIEADIPDGIIAHSDPEMLSIVWNNLISNAIKFTEPGGRVAVSLCKQEDTVAVTVSDSGCGISREVGRRMFDKFYQGETSHSTEGNGLGLAMVRRIIDITSSEISVDSTLGIGTSFTVRVRGGKNG